MTGSVARPVFTIGHSTRELDDFTGILRTQAVERVADVRTVPRSRHNPQFNRDTLPQALATAGIGYVHLPGLGGLRHPRADSPNAGWRNASFRGYADYMQTATFSAELDGLIALAAETQIAVMCAEAVPWRCHRSLIADALVARGVPVEHILSAAHREPHALTAFAVVSGGQVVYPAASNQPTLPLKSARSSRSR